MPRLTAEEREYKRELTRHLFHMHGGFGLSSEEAKLSPLTVEQLDKIHRMLHTDQYACPPHEHKDATEGFDLGKIKLTLGKGYLDMIKKEVRG